MPRFIKIILIRSFWLVVRPATVPFLYLMAFIAGRCRKSIDVGLGPLPMINNIYHKKAFIQAGYSAETFIHKPYFITSEFDFIAHEYFSQHSLLRNRFLGSAHFIYGYLFLRAIFRYRVLFFYFNGGPLGADPKLSRHEPRLLRLAKVKTIVTGYGGDVQDLFRSPNLLYRHAIGCDYPAHAKRRLLIDDAVERWTQHADHIIGGCDWVYYMTRWDTLTLAHFSIDTERWKPLGSRDGKAPFRVLHAPNHRTIKGTQFIIDAVQRLQAKGHAIELVLLEGVPNHKIQEAIASVDLVADQLIIGWYAMFALEAMAMEKPVICNLDPTLLDLYECAGLVQRGEIPLINARWDNIEETIERCMLERESLAETGRRGREFVLRHHSTGHISAVFKTIMDNMQESK